MKPFTVSTSKNSPDVTLAISAGHIACCVAADENETSSNHANVVPGQDAGSSIQTGETINPPTVGSPLQKSSDSRRKRGSIISGPENFFDEYKKMSKDALASFIYRDHIDKHGGTVVINSSLSPLKRLQVLKAIFLHAVDNKDDNITFTGLNMFNVRVNIENGLSFKLKKLFFGRRGYLGDIDVEIGVPRFESETQISHEDEKELIAMNAFSFEVLGIAADRNGFVVVPKWIRDLIVTCPVDFSTGDVRDPLKILRKFSSAADMHENLIVFINCYNFRLWKKYLELAKSVNDTQFAEACQNICESLPNKLEWKHISFLVTSADFMTQTEMCGENKYMTITEWLAFFDECIEAIHDHQDEYNKQKLKYSDKVYRASALMEHISNNNSQSLCPLAAAIATFFENEATECRSKQLKWINFVVPSSDNMSQTEISSVDEGITESVNSFETKYFVPFDRASTSEMVELVVDDDSQVCPAEEKITSF